MGKVEEMVDEKVEALKPCPLCGSDDLILRDIAGWELDCRGCELSLVLSNDPSREGLIARWNNRSNTRQRAERAAEKIIKIVEAYAQGKRGFYDSEITDIIAAEFEKP